MLPAAVWSMDWPEAASLLQHWQRQPPVNELLAVFLGAKPRAQAVDPQEEAEKDAMINRVSKQEFRNLLAQHGLPTGDDDERQEG